jgi:hypothetical protein
MKLAPRCSSTRTLSNSGLRLVMGERANKDGVRTLAGFLASRSGAERSLYAPVPCSPTSI